MVKKIKLLDKIHLQKYLYLIDAFLSNSISVAIFEQYFIQIRRDDSYWLSSSFDNEVGNILDSIFLDIDEYAPDELYDINDKFNINESKLRERMKDKSTLLNSLLKANH